MFKHIHIKFLLPLSFLILLLLILFSSLLSKEYFKVESLRELENAMQLVSCLSKVIHETQKERGISSGYLASKGHKFTKELSIQKSLSDKKIKILKLCLKDLKSVQLKNNLIHSLKNLENLQDTRKKILSKSMTVREAIIFYSNINSKFLKIIQKITNVSKLPKITQNILAYSNFLYAKENAAIERGIGTAMLSNREFLDKNRVKFIKLIAVQDLYLDKFFNYASDSTVNLYKETMQGEEELIITKIRGYIFNSKNNDIKDINPIIWLKNMTIKINKLKIVNDMIERKIVLNINSQLSKASNRYRLLMLINFLIVVIFIFMMMKIIRIIKKERRTRLLIEKYVISSTTDLKGNITYASKAFCNISGYKEEELIGKSHRIVRHKDMPSSTFKDIWDTIKSGKVWAGRVKNATKDGGYYWVYATIEPLFDNKGNIEGYAAVRIDITNSISLEVKIQEEVEKNKIQNIAMIQQSKLAQMGEMISMIAHQWRQPLTAISATSGSMHLKAKIGKIDADTIIDLSNKISDYSQHLSSTINDFREFFKPKKEKNTTSFKQIIEGVLSIIESSISTKEIKIIQEYNCDSLFSTYSNEMKQVILSLLKNAEDALIETDTKNPYIKINTYSDDTSHILEISDNAGGIPEDIIDKIFDPYFSTKLKKDGTGLGLYMGKIIIQEHCNGELLVENDEFGAKFSIRLGKENA
jgi:PAS domain S-box-containing protein